MLAYNDQYVSNLQSASSPRKNLSHRLCLHSDRCRVHSGPGLLRVSVCGAGLRGPAAPGFRGAAGLHFGDPFRHCPKLRDAGIRVAVENYNHDTRDHWKLVSDASLRGENTFELVSPILIGEDGLKELETVCWVLDLCDVKINDSCGFHVHMDAANFNMDTWKNMALTYKRLESVIDSFMPGSRRDNQYCRSLNAISEVKIRSASTISELQRVFNNQRYYKLNLEAYSRHRTVEFRQHSGTTDFTKMEKWIRFLNGLITFAQAGNIPSRTSLENLPFLNDKEKIFFKIRTKKLAR